MAKEEIEAEMVLEGVDQQKTGLISYSKGRKTLSEKRRTLSQPSSQNISFNNREPVENHFSLIPQERFPELLRLNSSVQGRPVFWFHSGVGGVNDYAGFAEVSQRPFYGIEARGFRTN